MTETSIHAQAEAKDETHNRRLLCLTALVNAYKYLELDEQAQINFVEEYGYWYRVSTSSNAVKVEMIRERTDPSDTYHEYSFEIIKRSVFADDASVAIFRGPDLTPEEMESYRKNENVGLDLARFPLLTNNDLSEAEKLLFTQDFDERLYDTPHRSITQSLLSLAGVIIQ